MSNIWQRVTQLHHHYTTFKNNFSYHFTHPINHRWRLSITEVRHWAWKAFGRKSPSSPCDKRNLQPLNAIWWMRRLIQAPADLSAWKHRKCITHKQMALLSLNGWETGFAKQGRTSTGEDKGNLCFAVPAHSSILLHVLTQSEIDKLHVPGGRDAGREDERSLNSFTVTGMVLSTLR